MQELAISYAVVAWLFGWALDLFVQALRAPPDLAFIFKAVVVILCLAVVVFRLAHHGWLLAN